MREYFILLCDANRDDLEAVEDYEMGDFDLTTFWRGDRFEGTIPDEVRLQLGEGQAADLLGNPLSWLIMSKKLKTMLQPLCQTHVQFLPLTLWKKTKPNRMYTLANPLGSIDAVLARNKKKINIQRLELDSSAIPEEMHLFRLKHLETTFTISSVMFEVLKGKGLQGVAARKVALK